MSARSLLVNAAELLREPGTHKHIAAVLAPGEADAAHSAITGDITVDLDLESTLDDVGLRGTISVPWSGPCRRCLKPLAETLTVDVEERYAEEPTTDDDAFPIARGQIDLAAAIREHALLAADELRLCRDDCPGLCPVCGSDVSIEPCDCDQALVDDRWAILDQLREP